MSKLIKRSKYHPRFLYNVKIVYSNTVCSSLNLTRQFSTNNDKVNFKYTSPGVLENTQKVTFQLEKEIVFFC